MTRRSPRPPLLLVPIHGPRQQRLLLSFPVSSPIAATSTNNSGQARSEGDTYIGARWWSILCRWCWWPACYCWTTMACLLVIISEHIQHESVQSQPAGSSFQGRKLFEHWSTYEEACLEFSKLVDHVPKVFLGTVWTFRWFEYMFHQLN